MNSAGRLQVTKSLIASANIINAGVVHGFVICIMLVYLFVESKVNATTGKHVNALR